jgi:hypothetical protein
MLAAESKNVELEIFPVYLKTIYTQLLILKISTFLNKIIKYIEADILLQVLVVIFHY